MYRVRRQSITIILIAFVLVLILSSLFSHSEPPPALYIAFVVVSLAVANLLALLAVQLHRLESEAVTDPLTGAFNRRYFEKRLKQEIKRADRTQRPMAALFLDIDNFKAYNDQHGHNAGDEWIKRIVDTLSQCVREMDIIARHGGEEFVVLLPEADVDAAASVAERARQIISAGNSDPSGSDDQRLTVTIGVAAYRIGESATSFLQRADHAMYQGKLQGKNQTCLDPHDAKGAILLVEDDQGIRDLCRRVLLQGGFHVDAADSGESALKMAQEGRYHLVISDMYLSGVSGLEILKRVRVRHPDTPAISISGEIADEDRHALTALGNVQFLGKPFEIQDLVDRVVESTSRMRSETAVSDS